MADPVRCVRQDGVATLILDRPQALNALGPELSSALLAALRASTADERTRAVVLTGAGRAFSAGGDIGWFNEAYAGGPAQGQAEIGRFMQELGNPITQAIAHCPVPVVAAVNGPCAGGAVGFALAADIVLAARSAYFLLPQVAQLGIVPDLGATWPLARLIGRSRALGMALLGERVDAAQAEQWGLIWRCVEDIDLPAQAHAIAQRLGGLRAPAVRDTRRLVDAAQANTLAQQLDEERRTQHDHLAQPGLKQTCERFLARAKNH